MSKEPIYGPGYNDYGRFKPKISNKLKDFLNNIEKETIDKIKILVPVGCRSDKGLSAPIIKRLKEAGITQAAMAKKLKISPAYFNDMVLRRRPVPEQMYDRMIKEMGR